MKNVKRKSCFLIIALVGMMCGIFFTKDALGFEFPRYEIEATIDVQAKRISSTQVVTFTNNTQNPVKEVYFHAYPNREYTKKEKDFMMLYAGYFKMDPFPDGFQSGNMEFREISCEGKSLMFAFEGKDKTLLRVQLQKELKTGQSIKIELAYTVSIPHAYGRFGWHKNIFALSRFYPILSVLDEKGWNKNPFYPFHRPFFSDASIYEVKLTLPKDFVAIYSGDLESEQDVNGRRRLWIKTPLPIREFTLALSPDYKIAQEALNGVTVKSFYLTGDKVRGEKALEIARDTIEFYTDRFGAYPYKTFSIAPVYLGYGGEQMSNMIFIDTRVYQLPKILNRHFEFLIAHEIGHQWFYNLVGVNEFSEMWLEEGVNSYFILAYLENKYGFDADVIEWPKDLDWLLPNFSFRRARDYRYKILARIDLNYPLTSKLSSYKEPSSIFSLTYGKGASIVSMLRYVISDEAFARVFQRIFKDYRHRNFSVEQLIKLCEEEGGRDLRWFFSEWLETTESCDYAVGSVRGKEIILENRGGIHMPVDVEIDYRDGKKEIIRWNGKGHTEKILAEAGRLVKRVTIDPQKRLLDIDQTNNTWPRKVHIQPVAMYTPLHEIPLALPEDSYNIVFGPEAANSGLGIKAVAQKPYDQIVYAATDFEFGESLQHTRVGYQLKNVLNTQASLGFELFNINDWDDGERDLIGGKVYLRKELRPVAYSLSVINDHFTLYVMRDRSLNKGLSLSGWEDSRNASYLKKDEALVGGVLHLERNGPHPDPRQGFKSDLLLESSGHFLGATQYFYRGSWDVGVYHPVTAKSKIALRVKYGWGYPDDKNLYEAGGPFGLRGYDRKTVRGSRMGLGSLEYRFPLMKDLNISFLDHIIRLDAISGVVFADIGQSWFEDIDDVSLKKDAGGGLRCEVSIGSFLEKVLVRMDVAQAINDSKEDTKVWFGINHSF
ncbi:MAG: M1 family aminopeptidase [Candidatus Omnitrophota bacterium]